MLKKKKCITTPIEFTLSEKECFLNLFNDPLFIKLVTETDVWKPPVIPTKKPKPQSGVKNFIIDCVFYCLGIVIWTTVAIVILISCV